MKSTDLSKAAARITGAIERLLARLHPGSHLGRVPTADGCCVTVQTGQRYHAMKHGADVTECLVALHDELCAALAERIELDTAALVAAGRDGFTP